MYQPIFREYDIVSYYDPNKIKRQGSIVRFVGMDCVIQRDAPRGTVSKMNGFVPLGASL